MSSAANLVGVLKRIEGWLARHHPERMPLFRPAADGHTLRRVETKLGMPMPAELRLMYSAHDGQPEGAPSLYLNQRWLPADLMTVAWEDLSRRYCGHPSFSRSVGTPEHEPWSKAWLPLFGSSQGDHYCVDLRRRPSTGQVIWFLHDQPTRPVVAPSLSQLLLRVADGLDAGSWNLDDEYDGLCD